MIAFAVIIGVWIVFRWYLWHLPFNAAAPVGNGRSVIVNPEGTVSYEAGATEEVVTAVIDPQALPASVRLAIAYSVAVSPRWARIGRAVV